VDLNLDTLKREILDYLDSNEFAVFHGSAGGLDGFPLVLWDTEHHPDYQMFLDVARKSGVKLILFATREFEAADLDDLLGQLEACGLTREEHRDYESRLRELRIFEGVTCSLELAFDHHSRLYVYEVQPDWYEEFLGIEDELISRMSDDEDEMEEGGSLGGYFSKN
jgi:hypothetical protein